MLAIRMQRNGRAHLPMYRIIVQEAERHPLSGRVVAEVGNYNPETKKTVLDETKINFYLQNGARPSSRVAMLLKKQGIKLPKWFKEAPKKTSAPKHADKLRKNQPKAEAPAEFATPAEAPAEATAPTETPAEPTTETPAAA